MSDAERFYWRTLSPLTPSFISSSPLPSFRLTIILVAFIVLDAAFPAPRIHRRRRQPNQRARYGQGKGESGANAPACDRRCFKGKTRSPPPRPPDPGAYIADRGGQSSFKRSSPLALRSAGLRTTPQVASPRMLLLVALSHSPSLPRSLPFS